MEKKYQIFISSTYLDLKDERQAVSRAILDLGHIPSGMELFPATNSSQMEYIRKVIDDCDYYVIILGGRYGSVGPEGLSYTEQEYNYAIQTGLPVLAFIHENVGDLKVKNTDTDEGLKAQLAAFKEKVRGSRIVKLWSEIGNLQSSVITSLTSEFANSPRVGWRRDDGQLSREALDKIDKLTKQSENYRQYWLKSSEKVSGYENLAESSAEIKFYSEGALRKLNFSGEQIIREFAPHLSFGIAREDIASGLVSIISHEFDTPESQIKLAPKSLETVVLFFEVFEIASADELGNLIINPKKKYLLKAAFRPLAQVISDEIPF